MQWMNFPIYLSISRTFIRWNGKIPKGTSTVDWIEKDFSISEFKTATVRWSNDRAKTSFLQMVIYRYLFERRFGPVTSKLRFRVIYSKSARTVRQQVITYPAAEADFTQMIKVISAVVEGIRSETFFPNPSYRCMNCGFRADCSGARGTP